MLAYAANRPAAGKRQSSPHTLLVVVSAHVALLAAVMSAKMDLPRRIQHGPPLIDVRIAPPPAPPQPLPRSPRPQQVSRSIDHVDPTVPTRTPVLPSMTMDQNPPDEPVLGGGDMEVIPQVPEQPATAPVRHKPRLLTLPSELKPPYPASKLASEEEATLTLRLTIDDRGRVVAVDPVGRADAIFVEAARHYMVAHWKYDPATENGRPIASTMVITLRFELDR